MRKLLIFLLIPALLCPCGASAAESPRYLALTFEGCPGEEDTRALLEGLEARGVRATFFLRAEDGPQAAGLLEGGHEIGLLSLARPGQSRREIAREFSDIRAALPDCRVRFLRPGAQVFDGLRQVAGAQGLTILEPTLDPWAAAPAGRSLLDRAADGDVLRMGAGVAANTALNLIDLLKKEGFTLVTVSELARLRGVSLRPGALCRGFPAGVE